MRHDDAGDVGRLIARIADHLQDGAAVVRFEAGLVIGIAEVAQRVIHVDQHLAVLVVLRIGEGDLAGEVFRDLGAGIRLVGEVLQRHAVGFVVAGGPELDAPVAAIQFEILGARPWHRKRARCRVRRRLLRDDFHHGAHHIAVVHLGGAGQWTSPRSSRRLPWLEAGTEEPPFWPIILSSEFR